MRQQDGRCAICRMAETMVYRRTRKVFTLAIDHDHRSGRVRGLLCKRCNLMIGTVHEDIAILQAAIAYLEKWR
jgi:hypothetical protein